MVHIIMTTVEGKNYSNPEKIEMRRNEKTEIFYKFVENFAKEKQKKKENQKGPE